MDHAAHSENHDRIKAHFTGCNTVLIESFYKDEDHEFATVNHHSYATMSGKIMRESEVERAVPVHFSRKYTEPDIEELTAQFNRAFRGE
jgi:ribonuclease Z